MGMDGVVVFCFLFFVFWVVWFGWDGMDLIMTNINQ